MTTDFSGIFSNTAPVCTNGTRRMRSMPDRWDCLLPAFRFSAPSIHFTQKGQREADRILKRVRDSERAAMTALSEEEQLLLSITRRYITACREAMKSL